VFFRAVDVGLLNLVTGSFYYGAERVLQGLCHVVEVSRMAAARSGENARTPVALLYQQVGWV